MTNDEHTLELWQIHSNRTTYHYSIQYFVLVDLTHTMRTLKLILLSISVGSSNSWSIPAQERSASLSRRDYFGKAAIFGSSLIDTSFLNPLGASASIDAQGIAADVTDKVFVEIKGLPAADGSAPTTQRIVIGLFGKESPQSVEKLTKLLGPGLAAVCKPAEERVLQREQLEANKVYNSCIEGERRGVNYDYAQVWRIVKDERIDFGSVAGRFIAREYPTWEERYAFSITVYNSMVNFLTHCMRLSGSKLNGLKHDRAGLVSVRKGSNSGFGFTVFPGGNGNISDLDENHIIVGQGESCKY
jgi:cyclophilin family peptidyl-prolyl cis-trans isomerase